MWKNWESWADVVRSFNMLAAVEWAEVLIAENTAQNWDIEVLISALMRLHDRNRTQLRAVFSEKLKIVKIAICLINLFNYQC